MAGITYRWAKGSRFQIDAQVAGETLEAIREKNNGELTADTVVDAARRRRSPLHDVFEWDDEVAAGEFRKEQARDLIRHVKVVYLETEDKGERSVRAFVKLSDEEPYESTIAVLQDPAKSARLLARARAEMQSWIARYETLEELSAVVNIARSKIMPLLDSAVQ